MLAGVVLLVGESNEGYASRHPVLYATYLRRKKEVPEQTVWSTRGHIGCCPRFGALCPTCFRLTVSYADLDADLDSIHDELLPLGGIG